MAWLQKLVNYLGRIASRRPLTRASQARRVRVAEALDQRCYLSTFTGNVLNDFPVDDSLIVREAVSYTESPSADLLSVASGATGLILDALAFDYQSETDVLRVGFQGPVDNDQDLVIVGDVDNNGDGTTINPDALAPFPDLQDLDDVAIDGDIEVANLRFDFDFDPTNPEEVFTPDVLVGFDDDPARPFSVAGPGPIPGSFGDPLAPQFNLGAVQLVETDPAQPHFEFEVTDFGVLFEQQTGQTFGPDSVFHVVAVLGSSVDTVPESATSTLPVEIQFPPTVFPPEPPPLMPPTVTNPHFGTHVNSDHIGFVRVTVFGSAEFPVDQIDVSSVRFGESGQPGAQPILAFIKQVNREDFFPDATFVFRTTDLNLQPGVGNRVLSGETLDGTPIASETLVSNRRSLDPATIAQQVAPRFGAFPLPQGAETSFRDFRGFPINNHREALRLYNRAPVVQPALLPGMAGLPMTAMSPAVGQPLNASSMAMSSHESSHPIVPGSSVEAHEPFGMNQVDWDQPELAARPFTLSQVRPIPSPMTSANVNLDAIEPSMGQPDAELPQFAPELVDALLILGGAE